MKTRSRRITDMMLREVSEEDKNEARGKRSEERAAAALQLLCDQGEIAAFHHAWKWGELDRQGVDFLIWLEPGQNNLAALQVKSSNFARLEHLARSDNAIACIVVEDEDDLPALAMKILEELGLSTESLRETLVAAYTY